MRIAIIHCSFIYTGGGERIVLEQVRRLREAGHEVDCFAPVYDPNRCFPDIIADYRIKTFLPQLPRFVPLRYAIVMLLSCLLAPFFAYRFKNYDVLVGENQPGAWLAYVFSKITKRPYIVFLNHPNRILYPREHEDWAAVLDFKILSLFFSMIRPLVVRLDGHSVRKGKSYLVNGFFIGQEIERIYDIDWIGCPSGAPYLNSYDERKVDEDAVINGTTLPEKFVLYTGRHQPWKRIDWLIEIFALYRDKKGSGDGLHLIIPGPFTSHTFELQRLAQRFNVQDRVIFLGEITQKELFVLYKKALVYTFPSEREDFGIVVLEAMGQGLPVIAWNVGGPTDSVVDGETGYLVKAYDKKGFAEKMGLLVENAELCKQMGMKGLDRVRNEFSWEVHMQKLEKAMKDAKG